ncbi:MAG: hypothetical protein ACR2LK_15740 [Solirubrobacteraceae bacterium]
MALDTPAATASWSMLRRASRRASRSAGPVGAGAGVTIWCVMSESKMHHALAGVHEPIAPNRSVAPICKGDHLADRIATGAEAGRPSWVFGNRTAQSARRDPVMVPRLSLTVRANGVGFRSEPAPWFPGEGLGERLEAYLEAVSEVPDSRAARLAFSHLRPGDLTTWRHLAMAVMFDAYGWDAAVVAQAFGIGERGARKAIHGARPRLRASAAWPWACFTLAEARAEGFPAWHASGSLAAAGALALWERGANVPFGHQIAA